MVNNKPSSSYAAFPYSSAEAASRFGESVSRGRLAVHGKVEKSAAGTVPQIECLGEALGEGLEKLAMEVSASHRAIPESLVPRRHGTMSAMPLSERVEELAALAGAREDVEYLW